MERQSMTSFARPAPALLTTLFGVMLAAPAFAADFSASIVYDTGGKFDKSFNESA